MRIIKRSGEEVTFNKEKIEAAVKKANQSVSEADRLSEARIKLLANIVEGRCEELGHIPNVEEVQDMVIKELMKTTAYSLAQNYIIYRFQHNQMRGNTTDAEILSIVNGTNEELRTENANKNVSIASTQRDYMAGQTSRDISRRLLLPEEIVRAHDEGKIHFHDMDFFAQRIHNCCLVALDDMLQNGTIITDTMVEKPHSFSTACNIATQIIAQVASNQHGGQTITLTHLAPFVDVSRKAIRKEVEEELALVGMDKDAETYETVREEIVQRRLTKEIEKGIQTIQQGNSI